MNVNRMRAQPALRALVRKCWPKEQHKTQGAAEAQMRSITKRDLEKDNSRIHVYECPDCVHPDTKKAAWHVGHGHGGDQ